MSIVEKGKEWNQDTLMIEGEWLSLMMCGHWSCKIELVQSLYFSTNSQFNKITVNCCQCVNVALFGRPLHSTNPLLSLFQSATGPAHVVCTYSLSSLLTISWAACSPTLSELWPWCPAPCHRSQQFDRSWIGVMTESAWHPVFYPV